MTNRTLNILAIFMVILMGIAAFAAGYLVRDLTGPFGAAERSDGELLEQTDLEIFWEAWERIDAHYLGELPSPERIAYGAIRGALSELADPYTIFIEPPAREQEREVLRGNFGGVGASLSRADDGTVRLAPIPGNPAEAAGVLRDDILVAVDGQLIDEVMPLNDVAQLIRGEKGTEVTLTVIHEGETEPVDIVIERADILIPSVSYRILREDASIGYIQLTRFSGESAGEVGAAIEALRDMGATKLILDLRGNGGGLLDAAVAVADHFLTDGPIMYQLSRDSDEQAFMANSEAAADEMPLLILIDGGTASAAEIVAGALRDRERAMLVGPSPSFGKGSVQLVFDLSDGSSVHVTSSRWFTPNRQPLDQEGLIPDIQSTITQAGVDNGLDETLEQAILFFQNGAN